MNAHERSPILSLEVDAGPRLPGEHPPPRDGPIQVTDDESAALLNGTEGPSRGAQDGHPSTASSRHRRALLLAVAAAILSMLTTSAVVAIAVTRPNAATRAASALTAPAPAPAPAAAAAANVPAARPYQSPGTDWGTSMYDVPVPQNVSMPPYATEVPPPLPVQVPTDGAYVRS